MSPDLDAAIEAVIDDEADPHQRALVAAALRDPALAAAVRLRLAVGRALPRLWGREDAVFTAQVMDRVRADQRAFAARIIARLRPRRTRPWAIAAAASLIAGITLLMWPGGSPPPGWTVATGGGLDADGRPMVSGEVLGAGGRVVVPEHGEVVLRAPAASLRLSGGSRLTLGPEPRAQARLEAGGCSVDLAHAFTLVTPNAQVGVLGTVFSVRIVDGRTIVAVAEGRVRVDRADGAIELAAGGAASTGPTPDVGTWLRAEPAARPRPGHGLLPVVAWWVQDPDLARASFERFATAIRLPLWPDPALIDDAAGYPRELLAVAQETKAPVVIGGGGLLPFWIDRIPAHWPATAVVRRPDGEPLLVDQRPVLSPLAPDAVAAEMGRPWGRSVRRWLALGAAPTAVVSDQNHGLANFHRLGDAYRNDPAIAAAIAASGDEGPRWWSRQHARLEGAALVAARAAADLPGSIPWVVVGGGWGVDRGRFRWWDEEHPRLEDRLGWESLPAPRLLGIGGWTAGDGTDPLTRALAVAAGQHRLGRPRMWPVLSGGDERLEGYATVVFALGAHGALVQDPPPHALQLEAPAPDGLPPALAQLARIARAHARATWADELLLDSEPVAGPEPHPYAQGSPALPGFALPTADPGAAAVARRGPEGRWLIAAWATSGRSRPLALTVPGLGAVTVEAHPWGGLWIARSSAGRAPTVEAVAAR